ncbi:5-formyltetrahydrofolate cyclo-ligase [Rubritalea profundi]|uniref:5-formyltetrahydrofolate cyclo-ligase n=1 Tax=Rubritalea profundi TaxID=1658618 RepID=A0A2S7TWQ9_9BACT|nr:5-formyltetrahydrofolate cyclo-ligase [Rubritalea profundi]PQJ27176.1 5-formyltetrahydrofolate cyclo-ligase [Rubritalea profundi]
MPDTLIKKQKQALRSEMQTMLQNLTTEQRTANSAAICRAITALVRASPTIRTIASFVALPSEPDLSELHASLPNHRLVYPRSLAGGAMHFHHVNDLNQMESGFYNIPQPLDNADTLVVPAEIDLFLCPGFAFSESGQRLGKGGGYYDRLLSQRSPSSRLVGICFREQVTQNLPTEDHDILVDQVISA